MTLCALPPLLSAQRVAALPSCVRTPYLLCVWAIAYEGLVSLYHLIVGVAALILVKGEGAALDDMLRNIPAGVRWANWVRQVIGWIVLHHVQTELLPTRVATLVNSI